MSKYIQDFCDDDETVDDVIDTFERLYHENQDEGNTAVAQAYNDAAIHLLRVFKND